LGGERIKALGEDRIEELMGDLEAVRAVDLDRIGNLGDDGQLLAGATLAALCAPSAASFRWINRRLAYALSLSFRHDEKVGFAAVHGMFDTPAVITSLVSLPPVELEKDPLDEAARADAAPARSKPAPAAGGGAPKRRR